MLRLQGYIGCLQNEVQREVVGIRRTEARFATGKTLAGRHITGILLNVCFFAGTMSAMQSERLSSAVHSKCLPALECEKPAQSGS